MSPELYYYSGNQNQKPSMKMLQHGMYAGEDNSGDRTLIVGVKLDQQSRELLTWALVKVAEPGDRVIALHVLANNDIVDQDGKSSLLSLVKAFDSVLEVYEGFCNLKQVDLKIKICRGTSVKKILVREVKSYVATKLIVGTARHHHTLGSSTSVAKYCAKKLSKECWVLAVNNGKIVFQKEGSPATISTPQVTKDSHRPTSLLNIFHQSLSKNAKVLNEGDIDVSTNNVNNQPEEEEQTLEQALAKAASDGKEGINKRKNCSVCATATRLEENSCSDNCEQNSGNDKENNSLAIVPVPALEETSTSLSLLVEKLPERQPGWPLLRCAVLSNRQAPERSPARNISVVQWAMRLPSRQLEHKESISEKSEDQSPNFDRESGAIVPVGAEVHSAPDDNLRNLPAELEGLHEKYSSACRLFKYRELVAATSNFLADNLVGKGGSSQVYKGCLPDGKELAVKILKPSEDVLKGFVLEIEIITALSHKNIISLLGFCFEDNNLLLVYDFLSRGSLEENLHGSKKDPNAFGWKERYQVALGVAEALDYLHSQSAQPVIHRDVKSSNILLSDDFEPQLCDFGLARWASTSSAHITCTDVAGTFGYLAPEYFMYGKVNEKIDVYAFGVVLLELLSGRKPISNDYPKGQESLVMWAVPILNNGKVSQLLDPSLGDNYDQKQMEQMALAATLCIRRAPRTRPQMEQVVKLLQGDDDVTKWARLQVNSFMDSDALEDEACTYTNIQSHLNLALHGVEDDSLSVSIVQQNISLEDYLRGRWSRSSSFD